MTCRPIFSILMMALLAACGTTPEDRQTSELPSLDELLAQMTEQSGKTCIEFRNLKGHRMVADGVISVSMRRGEHYLVTTAHSCRFLGNSSGTLVSDSWGTLCRGTGTIVQDASTCPVRHIYEFPSREEAMKTLKAAQERRDALEMIQGS